MRRGHVGCFDLASVNVLFAASAGLLELSTAQARPASWCLVAGAMTMPAGCVLCAWRAALRPPSAQAWRTTHGRGRPPGRGLPRRCRRYTPRTPGRGRA